jgi:hypothetical protein
VDVEMGVRAFWPPPVSGYSVSPSPVGIPIAVVVERLRVLLALAVAGHGE